MIAEKQLKLHSHLGLHLGNRGLVDKDVPITQCTGELGQLKYAQCICRGVVLQPACICLNGNAQFTGCRSPLGHT